MGRKKTKPIELLRQQFATFKRTGIVQAPTYASARCYVCKQKSAIADMRYIGKDEYGGEIYRHEHCEAGSGSWLKHRTDSKYRKYFRNNVSGDQS